MHNKNEICQEILDILASELAETPDAYAHIVEYFKKIKNSEDAQSLMLINDWNLAMLVARGEFPIANQRLENLILELHGPVKSRMAASL